MATQCNQCSDVWRAMFGCTGVATSKRTVDTRYRGKRYTVAACDVCAAVDKRHSAMTREALQAELQSIMQSAGVRDYRRAMVAFINGRPTIVGEWIR